MNKKILLALFLLVSSHAFAEESVSIQTEAPKEKKEEKTTSRITPEIERELIASSIGLGAGYRMNTGFLILGNCTWAFNKKISLGGTLGYNSYLKADLSTQPYVLYGSNLRVLLLDDVFHSSLDVAGDLSYLNQNIAQMIQPGLLAKYVFKGTPHFLNSSVFFTKYVNDDGYFNQFLSKPYASVKVPLDGYSTSLSYNYQLSPSWFLALQTSYSNHKITEKKWSDDTFSISREKKLKLAPMVGFYSVQIGYGYDFLKKRWGIELAGTPILFTF